MEDGKNRKTGLDILLGSTVLVAGIAIGVSILWPLAKQETPLTDITPAATSDNSPEPTDIRPASDESDFEVIIIHCADENFSNLLQASLNESLSSRDLSFRVINNDVGDTYAKVIVNVIPENDLYKIDLAIEESTPPLLSIETPTLPAYAYSPDGVSLFITKEQVVFASEIVTAILLLQAEKPEEALHIVEALKGEIPATDEEASSSNNAIYHFVSALTYQKLGQQIDALKTISQAIRYEPNFANAYLNRGAIYLESGDEQTAIDTFTRGLSAGINDEGRILFNLAIAHMETEDLSEAEALAEEAAVLMGRDEHLITLLGIIAYRNEDYLSAADLFSQVVTTTAEDPIAISNLGLAQIAAGLANDALSSFEKLINLRGEPDDYRHYAALLETQSRFDEALDAIDQAISRDPEDPSLILQRGRLYLTTNRLEESMADAEQALLIAPRMGEAYYLVGDILISQGLWNDARNNYSKAIELGVSDPDLFTNRGWASHMLRLTYAAAKDYQRALDQGCQQPEMLYWLGIAFLDSGYTGDALEILITAVNAVDTAEVNATLALALDANVRREEADQAFLRAIELDERFTDSDYLQTLTLWNQSSVIRAMSILRRLGYLE